MIEKGGILSKIFQKKENKSKKKKENNKGPAWIFEFFYSWVGW